MRMPFRLRQEPKQPKWSTNTEQEPVDEAFDKFIGTAAGRGVQGRDVLPEEIKVCTNTTPPETLLKFSTDMSTSGNP